MLNQLVVGQFRVHGRKVDGVWYESLQELILLFEIECYLFKGLDDPEATLASAFEGFEIFFAEGVDGDFQ